MFSWIPFLFTFHVHAMFPNTPSRELTHRWRPLRDSIKTHNLNYTRSQHILESPDSFCIASCRSDVQQFTLFVFKDSTHVDAILFGAEEDDEFLIESMCSWYRANTGLNVTFS